MDVTNNDFYDFLQESTLNDGFDTAPGPVPPVNYLLQEDGSFLLQEDGSRIIIT